MSWSDIIPCCPVCNSGDIRKRVMTNDYKCYSCMWTGKNPATREKLTRGRPVKLPAKNQEVV